MPLDLNTLKKGSRIRASWLKAELVSLAGAQMKTGARGVEVTGTIRHFRGTSSEPTALSQIRVYIDPDGDYKGEMTDVYGCTCGRKHVEINPVWIREIL